MSDKPKAQNIWHSALVAMGEVAVTVTSDVRPSRFPDKPPIVYLSIAGQERLYGLESEACRNFFMGQKGRTMVIKAEGDRATAALRFVRDAAPSAPTNGHGHHAAPPQQAHQAPPAAYQSPPQAHVPPPIPSAQPQPQPQPTTAPVATGAPPPLPVPATAPENRQAGNAPLAPGLQDVEPQRPNGRELSPREFFIQRGNLMIMALRSSRAVRDRWAQEHGEPMSNEEVHGMKTTLYLDGVKMGLAKHMPHDRWLAFPPQPQQKKDEGEKIG